MDCRRTTEERLAIQANGTLQVFFRLEFHVHKASKVALCIFPKTDRLDCAFREVFAHR